VWLGAVAVCAQVVAELFKYLADSGKADSGKGGKGGKKGGKR
jgi:hypothetical protein